MDHNLKASKLSYGINEHFPAVKESPLIQIRQSHENIVIPSVPHLFEETSPRSLESANRSLDTNASPASLMNQRTSVSPNRRRSSSKLSIQHPVKLKENSNTLIVDVDTSNEIHKSVSRLDVIASHLPRTVRESLRATDKAIENAKFLKQLESQIQRNTEARAAMMRPYFSDDLEDDMTDLNNLKSVHNSSGAVSIHGAKANEIVTFEGGGAHENNKLWGSKFEERIIDREEKLRKLMLEKKLKEELVANHIEAEEQKKKAKETILKLKTVNTLFDKRVTFESAKDAENVISQKLVKPWQQSRAREKQALSSSEETSVESGSRAKQALRALIPMILPPKPIAIPEDSLSLTTAGSRSEGGSLSTATDEFDEFGNIRTDVVLKFRPKDHLKKDEQKKVKDEIMNKLGDWSNSHIRQKLSELNHYVKAHTNRKILESWNLIEGRFRSSSHHKVTFIPSSVTGGLSQTVRQPALLLSSLTGLLSSSKVKISHQELKPLFEDMGFDDDTIFLARRIAALGAVLSITTEVKPEEALNYRFELQDLMKNDEPFVSLQELADRVFSTDPKERLIQEEHIKGKRQKEVQAMLEEKRRKEELKLQQELRRKQLVDNFEKTLEQIQMFFGTFTPARLEQFLRTVEHSKRTIEVQKDIAATKISPDIVAFLGIDAFPLLFQRKLKEREQKSGRDYSISWSLSLGKSFNEAFETCKSSMAAVRSSINPIDEEDDNEKEDHLEGEVAAEVDGEESVGEESVGEEDKGLLKQHEELDAVDKIALRATLDAAKQAMRASAPPKRRTREKNVDLKSFVEMQNQKSRQTQVRRFKPRDTEVRSWRWPRVSLLGPPPIVAVLREFVLIGRGLKDLTYQEAVSTLQYIATMKIQGCFRGFRRRWRYCVARRQWRLRFHKHKLRNFDAWKVLTKHCVFTRKFCWRKLIAWRFYTRRAIDRRNTFRVGFWPFYIWRKWAARKTTAKEKAKFLVGRVWPTLWTLKTFRAWKQATRMNTTILRRADKVHQVIVEKRYVHFFLFFRCWARKRRIIRKEWLRRGAEMRKDCLLRMLVVPFHVWKWYARYRLIVRNRFAKHVTVIRRLLLPMKEPLHSSSNTDRRMRWGKTQNFMMRNTERRRSILSSRAGSESGTEGGDISGMDEQSMIEAAIVAAEDFRVALQGTKPDFNWKLDFSDTYDLDEEVENVEDIPEALEVAIRRISSADDNTELTEASEPLQPLQEISEIPFSRQSDPMIRDNILDVQYFFKATDKWNMFEGAMRFHRCAFRVFNNLRIYARHRARSRYFRQRKLLDIKFMIFKAIQLYVDMTGTKKTPLSQLTPGEHLNNKVRVHLTKKMNRMRRTTEQVKAAFGPDHDDMSDEEEEIRKKKMRNLNLLDENDDSLEEKERQRRIQRTKLLEEEKRRRDEIFQAPDLLQWDRDDREIEAKLAKEMVKFGKENEQKCMKLIEESEQRIITKKADQKRIDDMVNEVLKLESDATLMAMDRQKAYVGDFKKHAADLLVDTLYKIYTEIQNSLNKEESKLYFRIMRLPMWMARTKSMYNRKKLKNWIRICKRLISINKNARNYRRLRTMWGVYNRWLKYLAQEKLNPTSGLVRKLRRRAALQPGLNKALEEKGFQRMVYHTSTRLQNAMAQRNFIFQRWKMYTQEEIMFRLMEEKARSSHRLKVLLKCFWVLRTHLHTQDYLSLTANEPKCFPLVQIQSDLQQISKRFISVVRSGMSRKIYHYNKKFINKLKLSGKTELSFKRFLSEFLQSSSLRISTEQRILSDSFEKRGTLDYKDFTAPERGSEHFPQIMRKLEGKGFADPHEFNINGTDETVPAGFRISKVKFVFISGVGVVGWQVVWSADTAHDVESPLRGSWNVAGMSVQEILIPKDEFLTGVEYMYDGATIVAVRFHYFSRGHSKWVGAKASLSTLSVRLNSTICPRQDFEDHRDRFLGADEVKQPALPYTYVIGFTGIINNNKATCLGLVVRKVQRQWLFSYYWVNDSLEKQHADATQKVALNGPPSIDARTVPSHCVVYDNPTEKKNLAEESITLSGVNSKATSVQSKRKETSSIAASKMTDDSDDDTLDESSQLSMSLGVPQSSDDDSDNDSRSLSTTASAKRRKQQSAERGAKKNKGIRDRLMKRRFGIANQVGFIAPPFAPEPLTPSENQFFDVLRMRTTELSHAFHRANTFSRNVWNSKEIRAHPDLHKLAYTKILTQLTKWLFNALSKRLIGISQTDKQGLVMLKEAKTMATKAESLRRRSIQVAAAARLMEITVQPWTGKPLLAPAMRAQKNAYTQKIKQLKENTVKYDLESKELKQKSIEAEKMGEALLPHIQLSKYIWENYKLKLAAARHKESLLERMSLNEVKEGLFGDNSKAALLSKDQMHAIHDSIKGQVLTLKDTTSLQRMVSDVLEEERELQHLEERRKTELQEKNQMILNSATSFRQRRMTRVISMMGSNHGSSLPQKKASLPKLPVRKNTTGQQLMTVSEVSHPAEEAPESSNIHKLKPIQGLSRTMPTFKTYTNDSVDTLDRTVDGSMALTDRTDFSFNKDMQSSTSIALSRPSSGSIQLLQGSLVSDPAVSEGRQGKKKKKEGKKKSSVSSSTGKLPRVKKL